MTGRTVVMAAGDTFRAAAAEQLGMWAERCRRRASCAAPRAAIRARSSSMPSRRASATGRRSRAGRHRRAAAHQGQPHGGAAQGAPGGREGRGHRHRGAARARRHHRPERPRAGPAVHRGGRAHRRGAHQARRLGQGRHRVRHPVRARHPGQARRPRRDAPTTSSPSTPTSSSTPCSPERPARLRPVLLRGLTHASIVQLAPARLARSCRSSWCWPSVETGVPALGRARVGTVVPGAGRSARRPASWGSGASSACVVGLAVGLLFAPVPGRELRAKLQALLGPGRAGSATPSWPSRWSSSSSTRRARGTCPSPTVAVVDGPGAASSGPVAARPRPATSWAGWPPPSRASAAVDNLLEVTTAEPGCRTGR